MAEVDLMRALPKPKRNIGARNAGRTPEAVRLSRQFGYDYFDGARETGYGGYRYDGRWIPVARDIVAHFELGPGSRVLDVGCAKGFLVKDLLEVCPGIDACGIDISRYALAHSEPDVAGRLIRGSCAALPFPDESFDAVVAKDVIHNQDREGCLRALREIQRVSGGRAFVQVDAYRDDEEKQAFLDWVLTARHHDFPDGWVELFALAGYTGDYFWTIT
jgi:SAM-dependent methyltransferase